MTAYIEITESETDPGAPGTSELWKKWRDNPIAMANQEVGSPLILGCSYPYNMNTVGDGATGIIWGYDVHGAVSTVESPALDPNYRYTAILENVLYRGSSFTVVREIYYNGSWQNSQTVASGTSPGTTNFYINTSASSEYYRDVPVVSSSLVDLSPPVAEKVRVRILSGSFTGGVIRLLKTKHRYFY